MLSWSSGLEGDIMEARVVELASKQQFLRRPDFINGLMTHKLVHVLAHYCGSVQDVLIE